jgi:hypothetical protein
MIGIDTYQEAYVDRIIASTRDAIRVTLARYGLNPSSVPVYEYKTQSFDYYIFGKEDLQKSGRTGKEFREFEISYDIKTSPNSTLIVQENGEMILRYGHPFTFQIFFKKIDNNLETIHFNSLELMNLPAA